MRSLKLSILSLSLAVLSAGTAPTLVNAAEPTPASAAGVVRIQKQKVADPAGVVGVTRIAKPTAARQLSLAVQQRPSQDLVVVRGQNASSTLPASLTEVVDNVSDGFSNLADRSYSSPAVGQEWQSTEYPYGSLRYRAQQTSFAMMGGMQRHVNYMTGEPNTYDATPCPNCDSGCDKCGYGLKQYLKCKFGYFIPSGNGGAGTPLFGKYHRVYPQDPYQYDQRDTRIYAAQGYGVPIAVPLAPVVGHTYNYGWGMPSSRLTPISRVAY